MKKILIILISLLTSGKCFGDGIFPLYTILNFASYQQGIGLSHHNIRPTVDISTAWWLANAGLNYQFSYGVNVYVGIGFSSVAQLQYGYAISLRKHMIRLRSDIPLGMLFYTRMLNNVFVGVYTEHTFDYKKKGATIGITISYVFAIDLAP